MINRPTHMSDDLLVSYLLNEADPDARRMVEDWIIETAENRRYFEHFKLIWDTSQNIATPPSIDEDKAWEKFRQRIEEPQRKSIVKTLFPRLRVAATILLCIGLAALTYFLWQTMGTNQVTIAANETSINQSLPDGSTITLNKHSSIEYEKSLRGNQRKVQLKGEAFFKVTPNKEKPFVVELKDIKVTVVGTSFNIRETDSSTDVVVESGIVKVASASNEVLLHPGEKITVRNNAQPTAVQKTNDKLYNYYVTKEFVCDDTPLWKLVETLNEAYNAKIEIADPAVAQLPLTTTFHNEPLDNILQVISETFNLTVVREGDRIILK